MKQGILLQTDFSVPFPGQYPGWIQRRVLCWMPWPHFTEQFDHCYRFNRVFQFDYRNVDFKFTSIWIKLWILSAIKLVLWPGSPTNTFWTWPCLFHHFRFTEGTWTFAGSVTHNLTLIRFSTRISAFRPIRPFGPNRLIGARLAQTIFRLWTNRKKNPVFRNGSRIFDTKLKTGSQKFETRWKLQSMRQKINETDLFKTKIIFLINIGHKISTTLNFDQSLIIILNSYNFNQNLRSYFYFDFFPEQPSQGMNFPRNTVSLYFFSRNHS